MPQVLRFVRVLVLLVLLADGNQADSFHVESDAARWVPHVKSTAIVAAPALPVVTWVSPGEQPGQAILVGVSTPTGWQHISYGQLTLRRAPQTDQYAAPSLGLSVLQQGNGTVVLALPNGFTLDHWNLELCTSATICTPAYPLYAPDVMWASCSGVACAAGEMLRLFGRRLAFDNEGCRRYNSTEPVSGTATRVLLTAAGAEAGIEVDAVTQSCWEARFKLPDALSPGSYKMEVATHLGGSLGPYSAPTQTDIQTLVISAKPTRGTKVFRPKERTGSAIVNALAAAAAHPGRGIVQLSAGIYALDASTTLSVGEGCTLRGAGMTETTLKFGKQTIGTALARKHMALIHGANTSQFWGLEDLAIEAPQSDHMNEYTGSPVVSDCGADVLPLNKFGLRDDNNSWACAGMFVSRVKITIDKTCAPGTAWPDQKDFLKSCGGYTAINSTEKGNTMVRSARMHVLVLSACSRIV